ncbi:MAG: nickel pincer cofactor biosynthesis protein LarC, partial [Candidatus Hydrogenedentes bacterium]|nr:nickel pincer cofactor biosynthesis protein LarC [Candidatus Hydrogenedentota bacterium]
MKTLYLDCFCGASGDMMVGALLDLGASFDALREGLASLGVTGYTLSADKVNKKGLEATQFKVAVDPDAPQPHRHLRHVLEIIEAGSLSAPVKEAAAATFRRIAEAEAAVHGSTVEKVHFHEVGAVDSIIDVVGAHIALELLGVERVLASPLPLGSGTIECAHGIMPVPAPATALLVKGVPAYGTDVEAELVTPTGAALVTQLAEAYGPMPLMEIDAIGLGSGTRDLPDRANVLRAFLGDTHDTPATEPITVIESNLDDMTPELVAALAADLIAAGARDAFVTPIVCKKGRPGHLITVLCDDERVPDVATLLFKGSTTFGVRMRHEH